MNNEQLKPLLAPLKRKGYVVLPARNLDMLRRLAEWETRGPIIMGEEVALVVTAAVSDLRNADLKVDNKSDEIGQQEEV